MAALRCMNAACEAAAPGGEWRRGWPLRSGAFASLCDQCGLAYEQLVFCELFHQKESGWRECFFCGKRLHCGCVASKPLLDLLDGGGVQCISCMKNSETSLMRSEVVDFLLQPSQTVLSLSSRVPKEEKANEYGTLLAGSTCELGSTSTDHKVDGDALSTGKIVQLVKNTEGSGCNNIFLDKRENYILNGSFGHINGDQVTILGNANFLNREQGLMVPSQILQRDDSNIAPKGTSTICESLTQSCLNMNSSNSNTGSMMVAVPRSAIPHMTLPVPSAIDEGRDQSRALSSFQQLQRSRNLLPKGPKSGQPTVSETTKEVGSHLRVARPSGEGRGRNQLLPRYWPRITDQELQQISGELSSNSTIVPLFEKVLSASDAGRIGRLVLPKACAEAYFPPISQPEGLPLTIQDARGKEWHFQFRFWPNNNSRMYVLEGVTPCIQSLQLQAGDTVTFSRIDPGGKLVMGYRKATNSVPLQDSQISAIANGALGSETFFSAVNENLPVVSGYSGFLQSRTGDPNFSSLSEHFNSTDGDISWQKTDKHGGIMMQPLLVMEKKRSRNIGSKCKRLHMDNEDALELKVTWEEAQDLLRPPPSVKPSIVVIEDQEFEEYEEPPVFGKRTIFTARTSGGQDQWIQCDDCLKWRRLPMDVLLPSKWTCTENIWDPQRSSCSVPDELSSKELQNLIQQNADLKRQKTAASCSRNPQDVESSGPDALANATILGDAENQTMSTSIATTTKHPRHRPGCTCIVCIQPPSGKGPKHNPMCTCNVCLTVKRRFKTLMMRKKQRQFEREEAEAAQKLTWNNSEEIEASSSLKNVQPLDYSRTLTEDIEMGKARIDLNCQPERDVGQQTGPSSSVVSMISLVHEANLPLETYLKQNGLTSLAGEQQVSSSSLTVPQTPGESKGRTPEESCFASVARDFDGGADESSCDPDKTTGNDAA